MLNKQLKKRKKALKTPENKVTTGQLKTGNPKQNKKEHGTTKHHKSTEHNQTSDTHTTTPHTKVITGQTEDQNASKVTKDEIKNQLKVKHNKNNCQKLVNKIKYYSECLLAHYLQVLVPYSFCKHVVKKTNKTPLYILIKPQQDKGTNSFSCRGYINWKLLL